MHVVHIILHVLEILKIYPLQKHQCMWYLSIHQNLTLLHFEATSKNRTIHKFPATQYHLHVLQLCLTLRTKMERENQDLALEQIKLKAAEQRVTVLESIK